MFNLYAIRDDFNSRSCEGATQGRGRDAPAQTHFNSRSCEGATGGIRAWRLPVPCISTHAPVKERPRGARRHPLPFGDFNSRSCEGATPLKPQTCAPKKNFNSRSCEGATGGGSGAVGGVQISTHAPVKERQGAAED